MARKKEKPDAKYRPTSKEKMFRKGDQMVTVTTEVQPAIIDFNDILACCEVVPDDDNEAPWKDCDGWEHETVAIDSDAGRGHTIDLEELKVPTRYQGDRKQFLYDGRWTDQYQWVPHYNPEHVARVDNYAKRLILVSMDQVKEWQGGPKKGEAKQVYQERLAECRREAIEQLVHWYKHGWQQWGVTCDFLDYTASLWGIWTEDDSDDDPYLDEVKEEIAAEVAGQLEKDGFTVINEPDYKTRHKSREYKQRALRWRITHNLGFDKLEEYRAWIEESPQDHPHEETLTAGAL